MSSLARALLEELLDDETLEVLADALAPRISDKIAIGRRSEDGWLDAKGAAEYVGLSIDALHRHTSARTIPFQQDGPNAKCWFRRSELDAWRRGEWQR